jgi:hypothetical protein
MILRASIIFAVSVLLLAARQELQEAPISKFAKLPDALREDLQIRGCTVPQPPFSRELTNVIRGHFRDTQHVDWAAVCDVRNKDMSMILVYWAGNFTGPAVLNASKLSKGNCWTEIAPVGKAFITEHYRAYGGPKPPPIDHEGINVGICDKASTVSYFYRNHWLTLTGSD